MKFARVFLVATSISLATSSACWGQTADNAAIAEALFQEAQRLINEGHVSEACVKFVESDKLDPGLGTKLSIADCYEREGKLAAAWAVFTEIIPAAQQAKRKDREEFAKNRADALAARVPKLMIVMDGADPKTVQVLRDGLTMGAATFGLSLPIDPGKHVIVARSPGFKDWSTDVDIAEGKTVEVKVPALKAEVATPQPPPPPPPLTRAPVVVPPVTKPTSGLRTGGFVALGVGAAGLVAFGVTGGLAMSKKSSVDETCPKNECANPTEAVAARNAWSDAQTLATITTVGLGVSGVAILVGVVMVITGKPSGENALVSRPIRAGVIAAGSSGAVFGVEGAF